jgi:hypothetical protein
MTAHRRIRLQMSRVPVFLSFHILQMSRAKLPPTTPRDPPKNNLFSVACPHVSNKKSSERAAAQSDTPIKPSKSQAMKWRFFNVERLPVASVMVSP